MGLVRRIRRHLLALAMLWGVFSPWGQAVSQAQFFPATRFEPIDEITLNLADSSTRTHLERVKAALADQQWDDAVEILRQVMEAHAGKMFELADDRYVGLRDYVQLRICALPTPALRLYRNRVDAQAERLYQAGVKSLDPQPLEQVVEQYFASSFGDQALFVLGEMALGKGNYPAARGCWERLIETPPGRIPGTTFDQLRHAPGIAAEDAQLLDRWYRAVETADSPVYQLHLADIMPDDHVRRLVRLWNQHGVLPTRISYPATDVDLASVRARLVLVSILEGATQRAKDELEGFGHLHPNAEGKLGGRTGKYVDLLSEMIQSSQQWPTIEPSQSWHTFAGSPRRNFTATEKLDLGSLVWKRPLERATASDFRVASSFGFSPRRIAEDSDGLLSHHPIVVGDQVFVAQQDRILGFQLQTGEPVWGAPEGVVFRLPESPVRTQTRHSQLGAPRFTLSAHGNLLFARMGAAVTSSVVDSPIAPQGAELKWFDLSRQAALIQSVKPENDKWSFDGVPVSDGENVFVAMRHGEVGPQTQAHVACYAVESGKLRWRRFICAAVTPGRSQMDEITHNLLTLDQGVLYFNTNLGAVAAVRAEDGEVLWITQYPRTTGGELSRTSSHFYRDLNPCVLHKGRLYVMPSDSVRITAINAQTGERLWASADGQPEDAIHLLGVSGNQLVASGDRLWWFDIDTGKLRHIWPEHTMPSPRGYGRGVLMGNEVVWPTREDLYHFDIAMRQPTGIDRLYQQGASGGNLVVAHGYVLIAASDMLYAFKRYSP